MTDYSELRRLAHEATETEMEWPRRYWLASIMADDWADFVAECKPETVLALIAESETIIAQFDECARLFVDAAEQALKAQRERDQLRGEVESLLGLIGECAEYLGSNDLNSICHGSILHRAMEAAMSKADLSDG